MLINITKEQLSKLEMLSFYGADGTSRKNEDRLSQILLQRNQ